jgi:hypothetical protein
MADATVTLGLDAAGITSGLKKVRSEFDGLSSHAQKVMARLNNSAAMRGPGGMRSMQFGNMGAQLQDVAVQAQMGTSALTIFAQQGSQLAGAFGPLGMAVGAGVAVFGALALAVSKNKEAFDKAKSGVDGFADSINRLDATSTVDQIASALGNGLEQMKALREEADKLGTVMGYITANAGGIFSGKGASSRGLESDYAQGDAMMAQVEAGKKAVAIGERETRIAELRAAGKKKEADEAQRLLDLEREIAAIRSKGFTKTSEDKLVEQATRRSQAGSGDDEAAKRKDESQRRVSGQRALAEARRAVEQFGETDPDKLKRLEHERANLANEVAAAKGDEFKQMQLAADLAKKDLDILQTKKAIEDDIVRSKKEQADEAERAFNKEADAQKEASDKAETAAKEAKSQSEARADIEAQMQILRAKASNQTEIARELERELEIRKRAKAIVDQTGASLKSAISASREMQSLEDKIKNKSGADTDGDGFISKREQRKSDLEQKRGQRKADSIKGFSRDQKGLSAFGGLEEFYGMQLEHEVYGSYGVGKRFKGGGYDRAGKSVSSDSIKRTFDVNDRLGLTKDNERLAAIMEKINQTLTDKLTID